MKRVFSPGTTYALFTSLTGFGFGLTATVYAFFLRSIGASYQDLAFINMVYWGTIVVMELPTGMLADGKSRAWSVRIGAAFTALGVLRYAFAHDIAAAITGELLIGIGAAFISGALQAWVADNLKRRGQFDRLRKTFATGAICRALAILVGGLVGAYIAASTNLRVIMQLNFVFSGLAFLVSLFFMNSDGEPEHRVTELEAFRRSWRLLKSHRALRWSTVASIVFGVVALWNMYWTIFFGPKVGEQASLGWLWVALYGSVTIAGFLVRRMKVRAGEEEVGLVISLAATAFGFILAGFLHSLPLLIIALMIHEAGRGGFEPLLDSFTQHHVDSSHRATYASFQSLLSKVGFVSALAVGAAIIGHTPESAPVIQNLWQFGGLFLLTAAILLYIVRPRHKRMA